MQHSKNRLTRLCILCGALCVIPLGAQQAEQQKGGFFGTSSLWGNTPSSFATSGELPSERQLAEAPVALLPQSPLPENGLNETDRPLLYIPPPGGGGPLGTPVKETLFFLAFLAILYGIICRIKNPITN
jgi:hypothetical protein